MKTKKELTVKELATMGGKARWAKLSAEERSAAAKKAIAARWKNHVKGKPAPKSD